MKTNIVITFTLIIFVLILIIKIEGGENNMTYIKSNINGQTYKVRILDDMDKAADMLAETHETLKKVCKMLYEKNPDDERIKVLHKRFPYTIIQESSFNSNQTSYSINKGDKIVLCLRTKDGTNKLVDKNILLFVALHELSHIMTKSVGHKSDFWKNFKFVLNECQKNGIYKCINFNIKPHPYCGIMITSSPMSCNSD